ncbi:MAG: 2,3-diaminopropionate biosynthesis protein SbnA [Chloroflexota bacterium]
MPPAGILSTIGNTPLVGLRRIFADNRRGFFAKVEGFNPGGSIKDRASYSILKNALESGIIRPGSTIVESSSGNMGIGMAVACAYLKLKFICVVDPKTTKQNIEILKAYGAEVDLVSEPDPLTGEFLEARLNRVRTLIHLHPNSFWTDQYSSLFNAMAHHQTMREIVAALDRAPDYLFLTTSTCGTLRGCAEYVREHNLHTRICAVDAVGSVIFGQQSRRRLIPGHGASRRPELFQSGLADHCIHVTDLDCVVGCRRLLKREAILAGGSSGAAIMGVESMRQQLPEGATCVAILADRGERYLDTIYSDSWVSEHFGDVADLWQD